MRSTLVIIILGLTALAGSGGVGILTASSRVQQTPMPTAGAPAWSPPASLVGVWERRDALLIVGSNGVARFAWRTDWCAADVAPPCDFQKGDTMVLGARADMRLLGALGEAPLRVLGRVTGVNIDGLLEPGPIELTLAAPDLIELRQHEWSVELCRPPREPNFCDLTAATPSLSR